MIVTWYYVLVPSKLLVTGEYKATFSFHRLIEKRGYVQHLW